MPPSAVASAYGDCLLLLPILEVGGPSLPVVRKSCGAVSCKGSDGDASRCQFYLGFVLNPDPRSCESESATIPSSHHPIAAVSQPESSSSKFPNAAAAD